VGHRIGLDLEVKRTSNHRPTGNRTPVVQPTTDMENYNGMTM